MILYFHKFNYILKRAFYQSPEEPGKLVYEVSELFDLRPAAIVRRFGLKAPIYEPTAAYGHMGRTPFVRDGLQFFGWEKLDSVPVIKNTFGI